MRLSQARALEWCKVQHSCTTAWQACRQRCHTRVLAGRLASTISRSSRRVRLGTVFAVIGTSRSLHAQMSALDIAGAPTLCRCWPATKEGVSVSPAVTLLFQCEPRPGTLSFPRQSRFDHAGSWSDACLVEEAPRLRARQNLLSHDGKDYSRCRCEHGCIMKNKTMSAVNLVVHVVLYKKAAVWRLHQRNLRYVMCGTQSDPVSTRQR